MPLRRSLTRSITPDRQFQHPQPYIEESDYRSNPIMTETGFSQKLKTHPPQVKDF